MMTHQPYVGVSGVTTPEQVRALLDAWPTNAPARSLMIGVLASSKTLCGRSNKYPERYPKVGDIARVFVDDPRALNLVHVACDSDPSTIDGKKIPPEVDMWRGFHAGGPLCHGIQLNGATVRTRWEIANDFRKLCPTATRLVLQIGPRWLTGKLEAASALSGLVMFTNTVTDILLDVSGGKGNLIAPSTAARLVKDARDSLARSGAAGGAIRFGIAGGLCEETLPAVAGLVREHGLSIDAEGRLRNERDELDLDKARAYLAAAAPLVCRGVR